MQERDVMMRLLGGHIKDIFRKKRLSLLADIQKRRT
jgi:hypothetical protein